jgi:hypothetical protein
MPIPRRRRSHRRLTTTLLGRRQEDPSIEVRPPPGRHPRPPEPLPRRRPWLLPPGQSLVALDRTPPGRIDNRSVPRGLAAGAGHRQSDREVSRCRVAHRQATKSKVKNYIMVPANQEHNHNIWDTEDSNRVSEVDAANCELRTTFYRVHQDRHK